MNDDKSVGSAMAGSAVGKLHADRRPVPADFAEHINEHLADLRKRYEAGNTTLYRWLEQMAAQGIVRTNSVGGSQPTPRPDDFAQVQAGKTVARLCEIYDVNKNIVSRWLRECGIERPRFVIAGTPKPDTGPRSVSSSPRGQIKPIRAFVDTSTAGQAADFLRRFAPVARCDAHGAYSERGTHWRRNSSVLTAEDVIARAKRLGWRDPMSLAA